MGRLAALPRLLVRPLVVGAAAAAVCSIAGAPAWAHAGEGSGPSNYQVRVLSVHPPTPAVDIDVGVGGQWVRLTRRGSAAVEVRGYRGEPFVRLAGGRVEVNPRSSVVEHNPDLAAVGPLPKPASGAGRVVVVRDGESVTWSDARLTGNGNSHGQQEWNLPLRVDGTRVTVTGNRTWVTPPSPWPWLAGLAAIAAAVAGLGWRLRWQHPTVVVLALAGATHVAHTLGAALAGHPDSTGPAWGTAVGHGLLCWPLVALATISTARRGEHAPLAIALAGAALAVLTATDVPALWHSQLPFAWPPAIERVLVLVSLGGGVGLTVAGIRRILTTTRETRPVQADEPAGPSMGDRPA